MPTDLAAQGLTEDPEDTRALLNRDRDMARLRLQTVERDQHDLAGQRDKLVAQIALLDRRLEELDNGEMATPEQAARFAAEAREKLDRSGGMRR